MKVNATAEHFSWVTREEPFEPTERLDDTVQIAQAIWELMDPEWREIVDEEHREKRGTVSLALSEV